MKVDATKTIRINRWSVSVDVDAEINLSVFTLSFIFNLGKEHTYIALGFLFFSASMLIEMEKGLTGGVE